MDRADFSNLILALTASAMEASPVEHQAKMIGSLDSVARFDAAWWGWSSFAGGRVRIVNSATHNLPRSFESAVRAVSSHDPFIRHGRSLPVFALALTPDEAPTAREFRSFAQAFGLTQMLNGHCRLGGSATYNFFMSLYRREPGPPFTAEEVADFRLILRHLEQSLSLSLRAEIRGRTPQGGEAALIDMESHVVRTSRGFFEALAAEGLTSRRQATILRKLAASGGEWVGSSVRLTAEPYGPDLLLLRLARPGVWDRLALQERRVAELYLTGLTSREVATAQRVSLSTVRNQIASIYRKTGADGKLALARLLMPGS